MIKAYHADDEFGGIKVEFEGSADEILREFAHIGEGIYTAVRHAMNYAADGYEDSDDEYEEYDLEPGDHFYYNGAEYVCLDIDDNDDYFAITADIVAKRPFNEHGDDGSNNWAISDLCEWLNGDYLNDNMKAEHLVLTPSDLTADNGDDQYEYCHNLVTLLSCDQYRKYRKLIPKYDEWVWTLTPWSCSVGSASSVRLVYPSGELYNTIATSTLGVAPACTFNHSILIARRQAHDGRIELVEREDN